VRRLITIFYQARKVTQVLKVNLVQSDQKVTRVILASKAHKVHKVFKAHKVQLAQKVILAHRAFRATQGQLVQTRPSPALKDLRATLAHKALPA
jgi:hypothetical protein